MVAEITNLHVHSSGGWNQEYHNGGSGATTFASSIAKLAVDRLDTLNTNYMNCIIYFDNKITIYLSKANKNAACPNQWKHQTVNWGMWRWTKWSSQRMKSTVHKQNIIWRLGLEAETLFLQQFFCFTSFMRVWVYMYVCNNSIPNIHDFNVNK